MGHSREASDLARRVGGVLYPTSSLQPGRVAKIISKLRPQVFFCKWSRISGVQTHYVAVLSCTVCSWHSTASPLGIIAIKMMK